jgi:hypothetical protein
VSPAKAGSGRKIKGLSARLKSCPVTKRWETDFFSGLFQACIDPPNSTRFSRSRAALSVRLKAYSTSRKYAKRQKGVPEAPVIGIALNDPRSETLQIRYAALGPEYIGAASGFCDCCGSTSFIAFQS